MDESEDESLGIYTFKNNQKQKTHDGIGGFSGPMDDEMSFCNAMRSTFLATFQLISPGILLY